MCHDVWQREEAVQRVHREAERKRQERELLKIQEEQERLQRKKVLLFSVYIQKQVIHGKCIRIDTIKMILQFNVHYNEKSLVVSNYEVVISKGYLSMQRFIS